MTVVVFDVGRVLVDFCFEGFQKFLVKNGAVLNGTEDFFSKTGIFDYEKGLISSKVFFSRINTLLKTPCEIDELEKRWREIFTPDNEMFKLLEETAKSNKTYLLSNTNRSHWEYLEETFNLSTYVDGLMTSFEAHSMKPENKIYQALLDKYDLKADEIIFIDDMEENIKAAKKLSFQTIHHVSAKKTKKTLNLLNP